MSLTAIDIYYPFTTAMLTLLGSSWLPSGQLEGFYKDTATHMDDYVTANTGFVARKALIVAAAVGNTPTQWAKAWTFGKKQLF